MSHYDTLGVQRDADASAIKAAFRRESSAAHPDRAGGDHERMAAVNEAYACLSDPESRERYDRTGSGRPAKTIEHEAREVLMAVFSQVLDAGDIVRAAHRKLDEGQGQIDETLRTARHKIDKLTKTRGRVRSTAAQNLVHMLIDQQIGNAKDIVAQCEHGLTVGKAVRDMLAAYEQDPTAPAFTTGFAYTAAGVGWDMR